MPTGGSKRDPETQIPVPAGHDAKLRKPVRTLSAPAQLSGTARVTGNVGSIALDRGMILGGSAAGTAETPDTVRASMSETPVLEMLSDAEVMLRVAAGDDGAFDYLVDKLDRKRAAY